MLRMNRRVRAAGTQPDYSLCDQTVTVYHQDAEKHVSRTVIHGVHLGFKSVHTLDKTGGKTERAFLLVIPQSACAYVPPGAYAGAPGTYTLAALDKVYFNEGPQVEDAAWASFLPARIDGLLVVRQVDPKYLCGRLCHVEASG